MRTKLFAALCGLMLGLALLVSPSASAAVTANVVFGGFNDPSGQGCANGLVATGHIGVGELVVLPGYPAHMEPWLDGGMAGSTAIGLPGGVDAVNQLRAQGKRVEVHGCSQGSDIAIAVALETGIPGSWLNLHGSPHPANGIFHSDIIQAPVIGDFINWVGALSRDRIPPAGAHAWYNEGDVWADYVPDQYDIGALIAKLTDTIQGDGHWVQPLVGAKCVFTDRFGVVNHVYDDGDPLTDNGC